VGEDGADGSGRTRGAAPAGASVPKPIRSCKGLAPTPSFHNLLWKGRQAQGATGRGPGRITARYRTATDARRVTPGRSEEGPRWRAPCGALGPCPRFCWRGTARRGVAWGGFGVASDGRRSSPPGASGGVADSDRRITGPVLGWVATVAAGDGLASRKRRLARRVRGRGQGLHSACSAGPERLSGPRRPRPRALGRPSRCVRAVPDGSPRELP